VSSVTEDGKRARNCSTDALRHAENQADNRYEYQFAARSSRFYGCILEMLSVLKRATVVESGILISHLSKGDLVYQQLLRFFALVHLHLVFRERFLLIE